MFATSIRLLNPCLAGNPLKIPRSVIQPEISAPDPTCVPPLGRSFCRRNMSSSPCQTKSWKLEQRLQIFIAPLRIQVPLYSCSSLSCRGSSSSTPWPGGGRGFSPVQGPSAGIHVDLVNHSASVLRQHVEIFGYSDDSSYYGESWV